MPFVQVVDVKENLHLADHTKQRISKLAQPKSVFVPAGEVLVTVQGSIGKVAITQYPSYIDRTLIVFEKYNTRTDKYFWAYTLQRKFEIEKRKAPGGTIKTITKKALSDFSIPITNYEEQGYLGTFFLKVDKLLTLYDRKFKLLSQVKKYFLDNLFAEKEYPNLRFKGFTDAWEQRQLENIFEKLNERNKNLEFNDSKTISIATMKYNPKGNGAKKLDGYKVLRKGDVAFEGHSNKKFKFGRFVLNDLDDGIISPRFAAIRPIDKMNVFFWKYYIHSEKVMRNILIHSTKRGTMMNELVYSDFFKQSILVPNNTEQNKVGIILNLVSNLLALYENKQQHLIAIKKTLLNTMFI